MQKSLIIFALITVTGCSVIKPSSGPADVISPVNDNVLISNVESNNLLSKDFYIRKGSVEIGRKEEKQRLLFTVKHSIPDTFLIVLKSTSGLEAARVYLAGDTVLINDRINRRVIRGSQSDLRRIGGVPASFIGLLFGDKLLKSSVLKESVYTKEGKLYIEQYKDGYTGESEIDRKSEKIKNAFWGKGPAARSITLKYSKFNNQYHIPEEVYFNTKTDTVTMLIRINKIETGKIDRIEFIPGKGYKYQDLR